MHEVLSGNAAGWVDVAVGVISVIVAIVLFRVDRREDQLGYAVLSNARLNTGGGAFGVEVSHGGVALDAPRTVTLRVCNFGRAITAADFETALSISVEPARIITAEVTYARPLDVKPEIKIDREVVRIEPLLLNSRDLFELQMLVDGEPNDVTASGRIRGISQIVRRDVPRDSWGSPWRMGFLGALMAWVTVILPAGLAVFVMVNSQSWGSTAFAAYLLGTALLMYRWSQLHLYRSSARFLRS